MKDYRKMEGTNKVNKNKNAKKNLKMGVKESKTNISRKKRAKRQR